MDQFSICIENAFVENFRECYMNSIQLALSVGVNENEILKTTEDIDDFFLKQRLKILDRNYLKWYIVNNKDQKNRILSVDI